MRARDEYSLTLATFIAGPFAMYTLAYFCGFKWDYDVEAKGLIMLSLGLVSLAPGYAADPGIARQKIAGR